MKSSKTITLRTQRTTIEILGESAAGLMLDFYLSNKEHLTVWEPQRSEQFYTLENWRKSLRENQALLESKKGFRFSALNHDRTEVVGQCNFSNVVHGAFQACNLGYAIASKYQGQGMMSEILTACLGYIFDEQNLHRVMANHMPSNIRSAALLERLGFEKEGYAKSCLMINGRWEDHVLTAKINPKHFDAV